MTRFLSVLAITVVVSTSVQAGEPVFTDQTIYNPVPENTELRPYQVSDASAVSAWIKRATQRRYRVRTPSAVAGVRG